MKQKVKMMERKTRNWLAVSAWMRNSAGPIKDQKKENNRNNCRKVRTNESNFSK